MASRIQGITVEIGGDTTKLQNALKGVNGQIRSTQSQLRDVKIVCGNCGSTYSRVKYTTRAGTAITKWRCGSCNKTNGHKICSNRYVTDETFKKLLVMSWNEIVEKQTNYQESW